MEIWVTRTLGGLVPADDEAKTAFDKHKLGSTFPLNLPVRTTRSGAWHRRYWVLMHLLGSNMDQVEVEPGMVLPIRNKDDAHLAMKYATGLFDSYVVRGSVVRMVKSTAFDAMTPDEWAAYWTKVLDAVHRVFLPGIEGPALEDEIARMAA
jgi:hypothetical protein